MVKLGDVRRLRFNGFKLGKGAALWLSAAVEEGQTEGGRKFSRSSCQRIEAHAGHDAVFR